LTMLSRSRFCNASHRKYNIQCAWLSRGAHRHPAGKRYKCSRWVFVCKVSQQGIMKRLRPTPPVQNFYGDMAPCFATVCW
jgi:hypothetical protein